MSNQASGLAAEQVSIAGALINCQTKILSGSQRVGCMEPDEGQATWIIGEGTKSILPDLEEVWEHKARRNSGSRVVGVDGFGNHPNPVASPQQLLQP
eukprot:scaffold38421_cov33-Prasinocladus_malaysianus.AAC.1